MGGVKTSGYMGCVYRRLIRYEDFPEWHERDLTNSAEGRIIPPLSSGALATR